MRIKILNQMVIIQILSIALILIVLLYPSSPARIVLGLPFIIFFPGYVFLKAIFVKKEFSDAIELIALSFAMSIAIVAFTGFFLNYTSWGIRLEPVLSALCLFVILASTIAIIRASWLENDARITTELNINLGKWKEARFGKSLNLILVILIIGALCVVGYISAAPKVGETSTEFYVLGSNGNTQGYPSDFILENGTATQINYGTGEYVATDGWGRVTIGLINHELGDAIYYVRIIISSEQVDVLSAGAVLKQLGPINLKAGEEWEQQVGFAPSEVGDNQEVDFLLFMNSGNDPIESLHLWINAKASN
jgi:uncharacterized membrane protein